MNHLVDRQLKSTKQLKPLVTAKVLSVGSYLPTERVTSDSLMEDIQTESRYGVDTNWMSRDMGIIERRMAPRSFQPI